MYCAGACKCSALNVRKMYNLHVSRAQSNQLTCFGTSESVQSPNTCSWLAPPSPVEHSSVACVGLMRAALVVSDCRDGFELLRCEIV